MKRDDQNYLSKTIVKLTVENNKVMDLITTGHKDVIKSLTTFKERHIARSKSENAWKGVNQSNRFDPKRSSMNASALSTITNQLNHLNLSQYNQGSNQQALNQSSSSKNLMQLQVPKNSSYPQNAPMSRNNHLAQTAS